MASATPGEAFEGVEVSGPAGPVVEEGVRPSGVTLSSSPPHAAAANATAVRAITTASSHPILLMLPLGDVPVFEERAHVLMTHSRRSDPFLSRALRDLMHCSDVLLRSCHWVLTGEVKGMVPGIGPPRWSAPPGGAVEVEGVVSQQTREDVREFVGQKAGCACVHRKAQIPPLRLVLGWTRVGSRAGTTHVRRECSNRLSIVIRLGRKESVHQRPMDAFIVTHRLARALRRLGYLVGEDC